MGGIPSQGRLGALADGSTGLTRCDQEPIHVPGHIQPHGVLIATHQGGVRVSHVSANLRDSTGLDPALVLDADLSDVLGAKAFGALKPELLSGPCAPSSVLTLDLPLPIQPKRNVIVHRHLGRMIVELEEPANAETPSVAIIQRVVSDLSAAPTVGRLCDVAARTVRGITGYDRVMIYRFDPEGHGTVVAEDKAEALEPYLDLRYPASDIPSQARQLYILQRLRTIPDVLYSPVGLLSRHADTSELDMSLCALRGVSPLHIEYLRNMGVRATMAISLIQENQLWGMVVCHHRQPKAPDAFLRELCGMIGQLMSVLVHKASDAAALADRLRRHRAVSGLEPELQSSDDIAAALARQGEALLDLMGASGAVINIGGRGCTIGAAPPLEQALGMIGALRNTHGEAIVAIADAGVAGGVAGDCPETASGVLVMPTLNNPSDAIAWFRREQRHTVRWGGNPNKAMLQASDQESLTPRKSFAAWAEVVRGRSEPWTANDMEAAQELHRMIMGVLLSQAEARLAQLSAYDPLTALPNRRTLEARMARFAADAAQPLAAMLFLDLDRFKAINDVLGHVAGDQVLVEVAARLRRLTPEGALAGRLGGDEFVIFWPGAGRAEAQSLAQRLIQAMAEPFILSDQSLRVSGSVGIAWSDIGGLDRLMPQADEAMYAAKRHGGAGMAVFHPILHAEALNTLRLEQDLFRALDDDQITVHYQPVFRAADRTLMGFEALARWRHSDRGWISPAEFIPVAEESGLIARLGAQIMTSAIRQHGQWLRLNGELGLSINVSALQLVDRALVDLLTELLETEAVPADRVYVEVTETVLMKESSMAQLHRLRAMGVAIAMDDFGTGYSSLAYLQDLPVDMVKIDGKFVQRLGSSAKADGVFRAIVSLSHTLGLTVVAEGCETEEQLRVIRDAGCDGVQGWLVGRASAPEEITARLLGGA